ncbi:MAG: glycoside hydrolase family 5 protein [Lachnospiraceae bacterium]|nr:glycoside hydrolase family 5 protein [Lachnospiraceae bacterium]
MKKYISLALTAAMCLSLAGCTGGAKDETTTAAQTTQATEQTDAQTEAQTEEQTTQATASDEMRDITAKELVSEMKIGWNLGNVLDSVNDSIAIDADPYEFETAWGAQYTSQMQIDYVLDAGYNVIRIPVSWANHIHDDGSYTIEESWMDRVQEVVDYAYGRGAYVILNTHHEAWCYTFADNEEAAATELAAVWTQIGTRFADYGDHLIFEGLNEPRKVGAGNEWYGDDEGRQIVNHLEQVFYDTVRGLGGKNADRFLMITGYAASSSTTNLQAITLPNPDDDKLIISVHAYIPYSFALDTKGTDTWNNATSDIDNLMRDLKSLFIDKGIPVIIGEMAAVNKDNDAERIAWVEYYINAAKAIGVPCCWWDNHSFTGDGENLGLLRCQGMNISWKFPDLVETMISAAYAE